ncbi:TPA: hypothetical protein H1012_04235 [archaeon]|nr:hypothetical protein [Candidatus Naiadarchaeales archaeon SRR2090153.bin461]HIK03022.1 hypothetical protein [Candidatus Naiadarchaeales archaeon SRR2090159.bin1288]
MATKRGRPVKSLIRDRMKEILAVLGSSYGYEIYKVYTAAFSKITLRSMYYHLNKGVEIGEFNLVGVREEKGSYTWGDKTTRRYYSLKEKGARINEDLVRVVQDLGLRKRK